MFYYLQSHKLIFVNNFFIGSTSFVLVAKLIKKEIIA